MIQYMGAIAPMLLPFIFSLSEVSHVPYFRPIL